MSKIFAQEKVWLNKSEYIEAVRVYHEKLSKNEVEKTITSGANLCGTRASDSLAPQDNSQITAISNQKDNDIEVVAMDCKTIGIYRNGSGNMVARVSIINSKGETIYEKFVKPTRKVTDYRTTVSGIRREDIEHGEEFSKVKTEVAQILKNKLLLGYSPEQDLKLLKISHPKYMIRNTSTYLKSMQFNKDQMPNLKQLTLHFLGASIQNGENSSIQDAKTALQLYMLIRDDWESQRNFNNNAVVQKQGYNDIEVVAIDCEKVAVRRKSILARVLIINSNGETIYDKFVKPTTKVRDYRTSFNGIQPKDIEHGEEFLKVKTEVAQILKNKLLVGHSLEHQLKVLEISHPQHMLRDTSTFSKFMQLNNGQKPSLKRLTFHYFETVLPNGKLRSVLNAKAALKLYMLVRDDWEQLNKKKRRSGN